MSNHTSVFGLTRERQTLDQHSSAFHKPISYIQSCGKICPALLQGELDNLRLLQAPMIRLSPFESGKSIVQIPFQ